MYQNEIVEVGFKTFNLNRNWTLRISIGFGISKNSNY